MAGSQIDVYIRLLNARRFQSGLSTAAAGVRAFETEVESAAAATSRWSQAQGALTGSFYALGAASRVAGFATSAAIGAITYAGLNFNAQMQANALAFSQFVGGAKNAEKFTKRLFTLAAEGPFEFDSITTAARRLLAFGFNAEETTAQLRILSDTLAYTGGDTDKILRITKAFGDIKSKGRLMQQELNQLTNAGIGGKGVGFNQALRKELNLTRKDMLNIGKAGIDGEKAIRAINNILKDTYGGGAKKYAETWNGQINKIKDYGKRAAGTLTKPLFDLLTAKTLPSIGDKLKNASDFFESDKWKKTSATIFKIMSGIVSTIGNAASELFNAFKPMQPFLENVLLPLLAGIAVAVIGGVVIGFKLLVIGVKIVSTALGFLGKLAKPLKPLFFAIGYVIGVVFGGWILKALGAMSKFGGIFRLVGGILNFLLIPLRLWIGAYRMLGGLIFKVGGWIVTKFISPLISFIPGLGRLVSGIAGFGSALRTKLVDGFKAVFLFLGKLHTKFISAGIKIGDALFQGMKRKIVQAFTGMVGIAASLGRGIADWLNANTPFGDKIDLGITSFTIPALAQGGYLSSGGLALVGERGPELVNLPTGSSVVPAAATVGARPGLAASAPSGSPFTGLRVALHAPIYLDKRQIGEAMGEYITDRRARA